jgi:photosystem II stability/assembly factor-like uncharacterized protein
MKLRMIFLLLTTALFVACGLNSVEVSVDDPTVESLSEPQVVTVVVVATPTPEPIVISSPAPTEQVTHNEETGSGDIATGEPHPNLPSGNWQPLSDLPRYINDLVVDPQNPQLLYAGTGSAGSGSGVYKSEDGGMTWRLAANGLPSEDVVALALSSAQPPILYALVGVRGDVYASTDSAQSWTHLGNSGIFGGFEHWMGVDPLDNNVIFALAKSGDLTRSSDGGHTWLPFGEGLPGDENNIHVLSLAIDPTNADVIYAGTGGFVGGGRGVYKSTDGGQTWSAVNQGMLDYRITALAVDPAYPQTVYAGADDGEFFKTADGGQTWEIFSDKLPLQRDSYPAIHKIILDSAETIFLMADRAGVFVSRDGAQTWQALGNPGESDSDFSAMALVSGSEPALVIGARRDGSWRYAAPPVPEASEEGG